MSLVTDPAQRSRALMGLLVANFCWGLSFPVIKAAVALHQRLEPTAGPWFLTAMVLAPRFLLASGLMAVWLVGRGQWRVTRREWRQGIILGGFAAAGMIFQSDGLQFTAASTSAFLTQFYAILIPIWVAWRLRYNPGLRVWAGAVLVLVGVAILGRFDWRELHLGRGEVSTLVASVFFMGQILWLEKREFAGNRALSITLVSFVTEALIFGGLALATMPSTEALVAPLSSGGWWILTLTLALICTVIAYSLMNLWQPKIEASEAGVIYCVEPIFASLLALVLPAWFSSMVGIDYPNETATWTLVVGGGLITAANVLVQMTGGGNRQDAGASRHQADRMKS